MALRFALPLMVAVGVIAYLILAFGLGLPGWVSAIVGGLAGFFVPGLIARTVRRRRAEAQR